MKQEPNSRDLGISRLQAGEQVKREVSVVFKGMETESLTLGSLVSFCIP